MDRKSIDRLWPHIHWLIVLAQQGSFTAASRHLAVSKAAMSQRMMELEHAVGVTLIRRTTRSVRLTEAGQKLVDDTREAYEQISTSFTRIQDLADSPSGLVRITAPVAFTRQQLVARLPEFLRQYPGIRLELDMNDELTSLASEGYDLAIRHVDTPPDLYIAHSLCQTRTLLVASPRYLDEHGHPAHPADLKDFRHLLYPRQRSSTSWVFERTGARSAQKRVTVPVRPDFVANNSEVLRDMACAGAGVALLPDFSAQEAILAGRLREILPHWRPVGTFGRTIFLLRPYSQTAPRAVLALAEHLRQAFAQGFGIRP